MTRRARNVLIFGALGCVSFGVLLMWARDLPGMVWFFGLGPWVVGGVIAYIDGKERDGGE